ncbi:MAG: 30S ribosomal protein S4 [Verrucomicrobiia bacterium]
MARYTGPRSKISRRFGVSLFGPSKALERKNYPPGQHGSKGRRKQSEYGIAVGEKQKLRYTYGLLERQFRRYFEMARKKRGITGEILLQFLESRLDNVVYRLGFALTRRQARQMIGHGHIAVNGRKVTIASFTVRSGQEIEVCNTPKARQMAVRNLEASQLTSVPSWLTLNKDVFKGVMGRVPTREEIQPLADEQLVVELYSR